MQCKETGKVQAVLRIYPAGCCEQSHPSIEETVERRPLAPHGNNAASHNMSGWGAANLSPQTPSLILSENEKFTIAKIAPVHTGVSLAGPAKAPNQLPTIGNETIGTTIRNKRLLFLTIQPIHPLILKSYIASCFSSSPFDTCAARRIPDSFPFPR